jgi:hypothetical protein
MADALRELRETWRGRVAALPNDYTKQPVRETLLTCIAELQAALAAPHEDGRVDTEPVCRNCGCTRHALTMAIMAGGVSCCPECTTMTVPMRNAIREQMAATLAAATPPDTSAVVWVDKETMAARDKFVENENALSALESLGLNALERSRIARILTRCRVAGEVAP